MSSESMPPSKPKSAPEAPTEMFDWINRAESKLPPNPDMKNSSPISTVVQVCKNQFTAKTRQAITSHTKIKPLRRKTAV